MNWLTQETAILAVGVLILVAPALQNLTTYYVKTLLTGANTAGDFEKQTAVELIDLKHRLAREGHTKASSICKDLIVAILYGEARSESK